LANKIEKLKKDIATLEDVDPDSPKLKKMKTELKELEAEGGVSTPGEDVFDLGVSEEELADVKSGFSNRPVEGEYAAVIGVVDREYSEKSMKIPITITAEGPWKGLEDAFYPSRSKEALFSIKNICESAGIKAQVNPKTKKMFYPLSQLEGRKIMAVYKLKLTPGTWTGNDGIERENTPQVKLAHAKPFYEKPKTII